MPPVHQPEAPVRGEVFVHRRGTVAYKWHTSQSMHEAPSQFERLPEHILRGLGQHSSIMSTQIQELIAAETKASSIVAEARACEQTTTSLPDEALLCFDS